MYTLINSLKNIFLLPLKIKENLEQNCIQSMKACWRHCTAIDDLLGRYNLDWDIAVMILLTLTSFNENGLATKVMSMVGGDEDHHYHVELYFLKIHSIFRYKGIK